MSYSQAPYTARPLISGGSISGTATASGTNSPTNADLKVAPPAFVRKTVVTSIQVIPEVATPANWTALKVIIKNGTSTVGTATGLATGTFGQVFSITPTAANSTFTANGAPTYVLDGTSTASGQSLGTYRVLFEVQEIPV